jgi:hypothetical protein
MAVKVIDHLGSEFRHRQPTCLVLVAMVVLACRLVGVAAAERHTVLKGPRVIPAEFSSLTYCLPAAVRPLCSTA